ncbi:MAG: hypothetical protein VYA56_04905, partial [Actinomycetota bacterium]|nr:hypothetical protein [Actinomycetota bacterium]
MGAGPLNPARVDTIAGCSAIGGDSDVRRRHTQGAAPVVAVDNDAAVAEGAPEYLRHGGQVATKQRFSSAGGRVGLGIAVQIDMVHREPVGAAEFFQRVD